MTVEQETQARDRFALGYSITSQGCWEWFGRMTPQGQRGRFTYEGKRIMAYRAGYLMAGNQLGKRDTLDHTCTNAGCVNPAHMEKCSLTENRWRDRHWAKPHVIRGKA